MKITFKNKAFSTSLILFLLLSVVSSILVSIPVKGASVNLAVIPDDWQMAYGADPQIIFLDTTVTHNGNPSVRIEAHVSGVDVNTYRENDIWPGIPVTAGDTVFFSIWIKTGSSTLGQNGVVGNGAIFGVDLYSATHRVREVSSSNPDALTDSDWWTYLDDPNQYVPFNSDWSYRELNFTIPATGNVYDESTGLMATEPIVSIIPWMVAASYITMPGYQQDQGVVWFADTTLYVNPDGSDLPPVSGQLFSDDFENGDLTQYSNGTSGATINCSSVSHHGDYGFMISGLDSGFDNAGIEYDIGAGYDEVYVRSLVQFVAAVPTQENLVLAGPKVDSEWNDHLMQLGFMGAAGGDKWCFRANDGGTEVDYLSGDTVSINANQWYTIEGYLNLNGTIKMWVDNVLVIDESGITFTGMNIYSVGLVGFIWDNEAAARAYAFDCFIASTEYIGLEFYTCSLNVVSPTSRIYASSAIDYEVGISGNDSSPSYQVNVYNSTGSPVGSNQTGATGSFTGLTVGTYTFAVSVICGYSNSTDYKEVTFWVNAAASENLEVYVVSPYNKTYTSGTVQVEMSFTGVGALVWFNVLNGSDYLYVENQTYSIATVLPELVSGSYIFEVWANSSYGETDSETIMFTVDLTAAPVLPKVNTTPFWIFLFNGDFLGFMQAELVATFISFEAALVLVVMMFMLPIYLRTKSLLLLGILWILLGSLFIVAIPMASGVALLFVSFGIAGVLWRVYHKGSSYY